MMSLSISCAPPTKRIIVVGGGITGLSAAHRLLELSDQSHSQLDVLLLEANQRVGGVITTHRPQGYVLDGGPDNFVTNKPWAVDLAKRLGIDDQLQSTNTAYRSALVARRGRLLAIPEGFLLMAPSRIWPMVLSPLFSLRCKLRMVMELFIPARRENTDESLASFVTRRLGREVLDRLIQPLIGGIYCADPQRLSLRATLPRFLEMETKQGSIIKAMRQNARRQAVTHTAARYSLFVTFRDGLQTMVDALAGKLTASRLRLGTPVQRISRMTDAGRWLVHPDNGPALEADGLLIACPNHRAAPMLAELDGQLAHRLNGIDYASSAVVYFAYHRKQIAHRLDAFGFVVPHIEKLNIMACSFSSVKYAGRAPQGYVLLRAFLGGALQQEILEQNDDALVQAARSDLEALLGITGEPLFTKLYRWQRATAQYHVGHLQTVQTIRQQLAPHIGLELAGSGFEGVGIPDCIHSGEYAAERLMQALNQ